MSVAETRLFQDIESSIVIPIMCDATFATSPRSLTKIGPTFRTAVGDSSAARARLRGKTFIHFFEHRAMLNSLVRKFISEGRPACIKYGLCHAGLGKSCRVDVANGDVIELVHDAVRELVNEVSALSGNLRVNFLGLVHLARPLHLAKLFLHRPVMTWVIDFLTGRQSGKVFQPKIDANAIADFFNWRIGYLNNDVQVPVTAGVLRKVAPIFNLAFWQLARIENTESISMKSEGIPFALHVAALERNPSKILFAPVSKIWLSILGSGADVSLAYSVNRPRMQTKLLATTAGELHQIKSGMPDAAKSQGVFLSVIAVVPDEIYRSCLLVQQPV